MGDDKELLRSNTQKNFEIKTDMQKNMGLDANQMKNGRPSLPGQEQLKKTASKKTGKIKELNREVPGNEIKQLPQVGKVRPMTKDEIAALKKVYNQKDKDIHVAALMELLGKNIEDAPKERNDVIFLKQPFLQKVEGGDGFVWAPGTNPLIIEHIDWLMEYFKINDDSIADYKEEHEDNVIPELPVNEYNVSVKGLENIYEYQGKTLNCYCCSGAAMLNQFLSIQNGQQQQVKYVDQLQIRNFSPRIKKYKQDFIFYADQEEYDDRIKELDAYAGKGKTAVGNVFELGDFFIDKLKEHNAMLNKMVFIVPQSDSEKEDRDSKIHHNMMAVFKDKVAEVLSTGNVVSFLTTSGSTGHYVTITGIKGDEIEYLDSYDEDLYNTVQKTTVSKLFRRYEGMSSQLEIEFISQKKAPEEMVQEFSSLEYSEENGYKVKVNSEENVFNVGQTKGLAVKKNFADLGPGMNEISHSVYFDNPKQQVETETIGEHVWVKEEYKEAGTKNKSKTAAKPETIIKAKTETAKEKKIINKETVKTNTIRKTKNRWTEEKELTEDDIIRNDEFEYEQRLKQKDREHRERVADDVAKVKKFLDKDQLEGKTAKQLKADKISKIKNHEKNNADYLSFGVAFDLKSVDINVSDSKHMRRVKMALSDYLEKRKAIFERRGLKEQTIRALMDGEDGHINGGSLISNDGLSYGSISETERQILGDSYEIVMQATKDYLLERSSLFKTKRRKERIKQVKKIRDQLMVDDYRFKLSEDKRNLDKSLDNKYSYEKVEGWRDARKAVMPTFQHIAQLDDFIDMNNMRYREQRKRERELDKLPGVGKRMKQYLDVGWYNSLARLGMLYNFLGGLTDRTIGAATMLAANTLELVGKVVKLPFKIASAIFNFGSKYIAKSDVRWRMDYSLTKGWKSLDDGRKIFRRYLKGAFILPAAVVETVTRGIPYLFGHYFKSPVYKRTRRWTKDITNDIGNVFGSLVSKKYGITQRSLNDMIMTGEVVDDNLKKKYKLKTDFSDTDSELMDDEVTEELDESFSSLELEREEEEKTQSSKAATNAPGIKDDLKVSK